MAVKAVHVSDIPNLYQISESSFPIYTARFSSGVDAGTKKKNENDDLKFLVIGHRGNGMNMLQSSDQRMKAIKENSILSFNAAGEYPVDFVEFDVQVTKDGCPIVFHDDVILSQENGTIYERRVTDLTLSEFLGYGPQRESINLNGKSLLRKTKDGRILNWDVESDDSLCILRDVFTTVKNPDLGFNIELKFDDHIVYKQEDLIHSLQSTLKVVFEQAGERPVIFSTFQPDAALLMRKLQTTYPVYFLTNGGTEIYYDVRRNSLEEAMKVCEEGGLQGIVSEVRGVFRNPAAVVKIKNSGLSLLTYGKLNNVPEAVYLQHLMGVEGVIVDLVREITEAVSKMIKHPQPLEKGGEGEDDEDDGVLEVKGKPQFSERELSFLLKLIPELIQL
ncbi:glycerophosphodiester phosphodiesterase GDPD1, chloroplastic-like [Impatiens glandulifera]|uniref:glycerophosphodiester phosphodiesterase GDPD1, chloroplastic-like n=1 Tax=Impatiens glandulifera TaxID=253017 RepID=UPI001FB09459|nr:glycerophosphodiester phosphodiesterase GDPD1, chloroplastic-like [Impatiens glandulifera]